MAKKRIVFIEPSGSKTNVFDNYMKLPLMGSLYLGTILDAAGYDVRIYNENIIGRKIDPFELHADVFCITALTVSANRAKFLASQIRKIHKDAKIIMGGIHASLLPQEFVDVADHVVVNEAETIIVDLIEGKLTDKIVQGSKLEDLGSLPLVNYALLEGLDNIDSIPIMTSRGCPFDCNFCAVTKVFGKKFRNISAERIVAEVENAMKHFKTRSFFFYDDNFTANHRRVEEFCDLIEKKKIKITFAAQVRSDLARDPELVDRMAEAGLTWVFVGFESINDETLKAYHKSQTRADIEKAIATFHTYGVNVHGMFMFGDDYCTPASMDETTQFAIDNDIDTVQFMLLTPFPGTGCYDDIVKEGRLFHNDWDYFNGMFIVFEPKNMSAVRLLEETHKAYSRFYSMRRTLVGMFQLAVNVFLDAMTWNFKRATRYGLDTLFLRGGAKLLVSKYTPLVEHYLEYVGEIERGRLLGRSPKA
jgi:anaerobic magnesium-protoporphyrin IX monomethyl ester cyclase